MLKKLISVTFLLFLSILLVACSTDESQDDQVSGGDANISTIHVTIPSTPGKLPSGAARQVKFMPGGGAGACRSECIDGALTGNTLVFTRFKANQRLHLIVYEEPKNGMGEGSFVTDWFVTTTSYGTAKVVIENGSTMDYGIFVMDDVTGRQVRSTRNMIED